MEITEPVITRQEIMFLDDKDFNPGNVILVTGAATGIGRGLAVAAAANGLMVVGLDINQEQGKKTQSMARELGGQMIFLGCDLNQDNQMGKAVQEAAKLGQVRYLANIAGLQHIDSVENFPMEKFDLMQRVMVRAPFFLSQLVIREIKKSPDGEGVIANMASAHAHITTKNKPSYNIAKFAQRALAQSISAEGGGKIRSFTVSTGFVKTPLALGQVPEQARQRGITQEQVVTEVMMGKSRIKEMMNPVEVANAFLYGMSRFGRYLVGGDLLLDGGMVLTY
ncbi:SDR family oxidoreductase [Dethiosulfatarculus sandiegensis]|uniref:D-beta-hydroxybutyrate dehydrogenase n=1 Tax=Dethiosulfatarculus sandiegensis TaxID=1429043 RepID=A0A0D2HUV5_9BACT|nr:SDR family oxidoreductase [Dethiosulfatarculus sandiegensis]KIX14203.1 D-beta-hydroxybutyrate dehydrogenase [Dethiosulfatarculus sandiegensis]